MIHHEIIDEITPDLVIANKEENLKKDIDKIAEKYPVWVSDISGMEDALDMILSLGTILDREQLSSELVTDIRSEFSKLESPGSATGIYLIWKKPYMAAGSDTYISEMMGLCGIKNAAGLRYPELSPADLLELNPEVVLLSSEPYPFKEIDVKEIQELLPDAEIRLVDGEYFSWYGSRMKEAPGYFNSLIQKINKYKIRPQ